MSRLLLVDDDSGVALILKSRLVAREHELTLAESGARGLALAREQRFDAVLISAHLERGIDGVETLKRMRAIPDQLGAALLMYSQETERPEHPERAFDAGCDAYPSGAELPTLERELALCLKRRRVQHELSEELRRAQEQLKRLQPPSAGERARAEPEAHPRESGEHQTALRELACSRPEGLLLVDGEGTVRWADRGACELLGMRLEGRHLGSLAPGSGLEAFVRDAHIEPREGFRLDPPARTRRAPRTLQACVIPLLAAPGSHEPPMKVVLFQDALRRRLASEALRLYQGGIPRAELGALIEAARTVFRPEGLLGESRAMSELRSAVSAAARLCDPVLVHGQVGTGKERVARILHFSGSSTGAFIEQRCAGFAPDNLDAELFGEARAVNGAAASTASAASTSAGAGNGHGHGNGHGNGNGHALPDRPGAFHLAQDGTLFLAEVGELPLALQKRVLAFLDHGSITRRGALRPERLDVRLIASSSADLAALASSGRFLPALLERLQACVLELPPLTAHLEDLETLIAMFVARFGAERGLREVAPEVLWVMRQHRWPGNVEELEQCLDFACARARDGIVRVEDLLPALRELYEDLPEHDLIPMPPPEARIEGTHMPAQRARDDAGRPSVQVTSYRELRPWDITDEDPVSLELYEKKALLRALSMVEGDKLEAAKLLQLGKSTMYRKLKRYGIA